MVKPIKYLKLYAREYKAFRSLVRLPRVTLDDLGFLAGLDMKYYSKNKKLLAKGIFIALGGHAPVNFDKW